MQAKFDNNFIMLIGLALYIKQANNVCIELVFCMYAYNDVTVVLMMVHV